MKYCDEIANRIFDKLLYRNQFILGAFFIDKLTFWKKIKVNNSVYLTVHPDLNTYQAFYEDKSITLLGFILDPDNPQASDADIINDMVHKLSDCDKFIEHTYKLGGRWILIVNDGKEIRLFNDAVGLRQVFYTDIEQTKDLWCASQPGIIAEILKLEMDKYAIDFIDSIKTRKKEYWWPGDSSPYREIKHLLPNHYLNLETGQCHRYWPNKPLRKLTLDRAVEEISEILKGLMKSASNRFDLALAITAGWDSRLVLAASKAISDKLSYETVMKIDMLEDHADIKVPSELLSYLGLKHDVIKSSYLMDDEFIKLYKKNVILAHDVWAPDAQAILDYYNQSKIAVTGSASEVARCFYGRSRSNGQKITAQMLSSLVAMGHNTFAIKAFEKWLSGLNEIYDYNILDLFYWEQRVGNWLSMCQLEFDIAWQDIFTPFNCRNLSTSMLSIEEKYRRPPEYKLYSKLIMNLWPEVLNVPINPHKKKRFASIIIIKSYIKTQLSRYVPHSVKTSLKRILQLETKNE